jgi:pilus assembly protein Flp/PilA
VSGKNGGASQNFRSHTRALRASRLDACGRVSAASHSRRNRVLVLCKTVLAPRRQIAEIASTEAATKRTRGKGESPAHSFGAIVGSLGDNNMRNLKEAVMKFVREEEGLTVVEYAIAGGLVGLAVVTAFTNLGTAVAGRINAIIAAL